MYVTRLLCPKLYLNMAYVDQRKPTLSSGPVGAFAALSRTKHLAADAEGAHGKFQDPEPTTKLERGVSVDARGRSKLEGVPEVDAQGGQGAPEASESRKSRHAGRRQGAGSATQLPRWAARAATGRELWGPEDGK